MCGAPVASRSMSREQPDRESLDRGSPVAIEVRGVYKRFRRHRVLEDVSFTVAPGRSMAIVGANGCGKSTLLKICAGLLSPTRGSVAVRGRLGYCPQELNLSRFLTPDDHFTWFGAGLQLDRDGSLEIGHRLAAALDWDVPRRQVRHLSGGTQQKLNVASTMVTAPNVILLDEPYQGFDQGSYLDFWDVVGERCAAGCAVVIVTHMLQELDRVDAVLDLSSRKGTA